MKNSGWVQQQRRYHKSLLGKLNLKDFNHDFLIDLIIECAGNLRYDPFCYYNDDVERQLIQEARAALQRGINMDG